MPIVAAVCGFKEQELISAILRIRSPCCRMESFVITGAPADLRDIPLGTVLHVKAYLPPDPNFSSVPVLPINNREKTAGYSGIGIAPAENHVLLLEDEPSYCQREKKFWQLKEVSVKNNEGMIKASYSSPGQGDKSASADESMTFDATTRIWRGRECLTVEELIAEGVWPTDGKKTLDGMQVMLGITWKPTPDGIFTRFHISDIWLDDVSMQRAAHQQNEKHKAFIRTRWMPAWIDAVEYGKFGRATITATLFGGMDHRCMPISRKSFRLYECGREYIEAFRWKLRTAHMSSRGPIVEVIRSSDEAPLEAAGFKFALRRT